MKDAQRLKLGQRIFDIREDVILRLGEDEFEEYVDSEFKPMFYDICVERGLSAFEVLIILLKKVIGNHDAFTLILACYAQTLMSDIPSLN